MISRPYSFAFIASLALLVLVYLVFFSHPNKDPSSILAREHPSIELLDSDFYTATPQTLMRSLPFTGTLRALKQAEIKSKLAGDIRSVLVREGQYVRANQALAQMDSLEAQAHADQNRASLDIAQRNYDNNKRLLDRGFISATAFESSVSNLKAAQAAAAVTDKNLRETSIRTPISGQVAERNVQPGEKVPMDYKLFTVLDPSKLEIEAPIPAEQISEIKIGQNVQLHIQGISEIIIGKVTRINPATSPNSRAVSVYIEINEPHQAKAGMFAEGEIILEQHENTLAVPYTALSAISEPTHSATVWQLNQQNKLTPQIVTLGIRTSPNRDAQIEILSGLNIGDKILRTQIENISPSVQVHITKDVSQPLGIIAPAPSYK